MNSAIASEIIAPYAQALMDAAKSNGLIDRIADDIQTILELLDSSDDLQQFLDNPLIKPEAKKAVIRQLLADTAQPYTLNFLMLLVDKGRILFLAGICKQYQALLRQINGVVLAEVISAAPLSGSQQDAIRRKVIEMTGAREAELEASLDATLIGGMVIKVGSQVVDASLRGQLRRIGLQLSSAA
ncbi:MAG: ATP synthase F1 subunit delta [Leptolyngbyaceae bacterium]|nr:ATP synthase F1 subunit delta [Leptolyngbyaceae bacterium]